MSASDATTATTSWTPEQRRAIETSGKAVLVSAAAGSGKTAALAARCAHLVCDSADRCDVDQLLVLTFTKAAAAEMRERIDSVIRKQVARADEAGIDDPHLQRQVRLLDRANITTLDSYCLTVVRQNFHALGIDPGFRLLDEDEARLQRTDVGKRLLDQLYEDDASGLLRRLIDEQCNGDDDMLLSRVIRCHDVLCSVVDPEGWLERALQRWRDAATDVASCDFGKRFGAMQREALASVRNGFARARAIAEPVDGLQPYVKHIDECVGRLEALGPLADAGDWDTLAATVEGKLFGTGPRMKQPFPPGKELCHEAINDAKDLINKGKAYQLLRWDAATLSTLVRDALPLAQEFVRVVRAFRERFDASKRQQRALDFGDLESLALRALNAPTSDAPIRPSPAALALRQQFRHVLVDEYQDINPLQDAILQLLSTDRDTAGAEGSAAEPSNLFCVGDVKQSIYGFRLAEPNQFLARQRRLREGPAALGCPIDLQANFRSRGGTLHAVNHVFRSLMSRATCGIDYDATHELVPGKSFPVDSSVAQFSGKPVELHIVDRDARGDADDHGTGPDDDDEFDLDTFEREALLIASRIHALVSPVDGSTPMHVLGKGPDKTESLRPIRYRDIAVLLRSARVKASQVADQLREFGIPVHATDPTGFFAAVEVQDVLSLLRVLSNGRLDVPMAALLRSPLVALMPPLVLSGGIRRPEDLMARVRIAYPADKFGFADACIAYAAERDDDVAGKLNAVLNQLVAWRERVTRRPLAEGLDSILTDTRYLSFLRGLPGGAQRVENVDELRRRAEQFGGFERQGLERFLQFIEQLEREDDLGQPSTESDTADVVRVMTVHRSKGLEFPVVVVPDLGKQHNKRSVMEPILLDRELGIGLHAADPARRAKYPTLPHLLLADAQNRQTIAEEIRVLYVALTRAREHLILVGSARAQEIDSLRKGFERHVGPLPAEHVLGSRGPLHWLLPIADVTNRVDAGTFDVTLHDEPGLKRLRAALPRAEEQAKLDPAIVDLRPLPVDPTPDDGSRAVVARLAWQYPFVAMTLAESRRSMSAHEEPAAHRRAGAGDSDASSTRAVAPEDDLFPMPKFLDAPRRRSAADVGTATHAALQYADLARAASVEAVRAQLDTMVERLLLSRADADVVDAESIVWLAGTELGGLLASRKSRVWRELDVARRVPHRRAGPDADPADCVLLRGRVDALIELSDGSLVLADYKTDRLRTGEAIDARVELYRPQIRNYAEALAEVTGRRVSATYLAFLSPREIRRVDAATE